MLVFSYDFGSFHGGYWKYEIKEENGIYKFTARGSNGVNLNLISIIEKTEIEELFDVIKKYNLSEWNGFNQGNNDILDGYSFDLKCNYKDESIVAYGYMEYPKNYKEAHSEITRFFDNLVQLKTVK